MIAVITGDLVNSASVNTETWIFQLKKFFTLFGPSPKFWEIYRGDAFQFRCETAEAFYKFLLLKSLIKQNADLDVKISIGIGNVDYDAEKITESNGTAFIRSGRTFDQLHDKTLLAFTTGNNDTDRSLNLLARFASIVMDNWSVSIAETVHIILKNPNWNQQQIADSLKVNQSAVSQNRKRAQLDLLLEMNDYYITAVTSLAP